MTVVATEFYAATPSDAANYTYVAPTEGYAATPSYSEYRKVITPTEYYAAVYSEVTSARIVVATELYGVHGDTIIVPYQRYLMRAWDADGTQWVYWDTVSPYALPLLTTPVAVGALTRTAVLHEIAMNDLYFYAHSMPVDLTESTATGIVEIAIAPDSVLGGTLEYTVTANDGNEFQVLEGDARFMAVNKAGTITAQTAAESNNSTCSAGTLATTTSVATGTDLITLKLNAVSSLTQTLLQAHWRIWWQGEATSVTPL